jgi:enoyl-CoA hydratase/carnithine racemase
MLLDGRPIAAAEAYRQGLVHRLVEPGEAVTAALEWAGWLANRPEWSLRACKQLVKSIRGLPQRDALRQEGQLYAEHFMRPDAQALARAALERYEAGGDSYEAFGIGR